MPELYFFVRWPDGRTEECYSPSTILRAYFEQDTTYTMVEFLARGRSGFHAASERVRARYGHPCSRALGQLSRIEAEAARHPADAQVTVGTFRE